MFRNVWCWCIVNGVNFFFVLVGFVIIFLCVVWGNIMVDVEVSKVGMFGCEFEVFKGEFGWVNDVCVWFLEVL